MTVEHFDVVVVGAGLSGIGAGYHLQDKCPDRSYVILEGRSDIGGTWDLFRYPGVRSDSDMHTLGFSFKPWTDAKSIADGPSILQYLRDTVREFGIDKHIRFNHRITNAEWSTADSIWTVTATRIPACPSMLTSASMLKFSILPLRRSFRRGWVTPSPAAASFWLSPLSFT